MGRTITIDPVYRSAYDAVRLAFSPVHGRVGSIYKMAVASTSGLELNYEERIAQNCQVKQIAENVCREFCGPAVIDIFRVLHSDFSELEEPITRILYGFKPEAMRDQFAVSILQGWSMRSLRQPAHNTRTWARILNTHEQTLYSQATAFKRGLSDSRDGGYAVVEWALEERGLI